MACYSVLLRYSYEAALLAPVRGKLREAGSHSPWAYSAIDIDFLLAQTVFPQIAMAGRQLGCCEQLRSVRDHFHPSCSSSLPHTSSLFSYGLCEALMSVFSAPCGLSKAQKAQDVPANQSGLQYISASVPSSLAEGRAGALDIPLGPSLLFCLSLQLGLSPEQDVLYMLMYALGSGVFAMLRTGGLKNVVGILAGVVSMTVVSSLFARRLLSFYKRSHLSVKIEDGEPKPMFFPVQTSHTRLFPQVHSLSYPFMWTGIPIGFRGTIGGVLSCERKIEKCRPAWFTIDACDYMPRSTDQIGLDGKLREFLISQVRSLPCASFRTS